MGNNNGTTCPLTSVKVVSEAAGEVELYCLASFFFFFFDALSRNFILVLALSRCFCEKIMCVCVEATE